MTTKTHAKQEFVCTCSQGLAELLAVELAELGIRKLRRLNSSVVFFGGLHQAYKVLLHSRLASRVLLVLSRFDAADADALYCGVRAIEWSEHLLPGGSLAVDARGTNTLLTDTRFIALKTKDAIVDSLRTPDGTRPSVDRERPDVRVNVAIKDRRATVALDLSGDPLHMRGYRVPNAAITAPLRENLAAALLALPGRKYIRYVDPLCGSGTIAIEAAMLLGHRAPGLLREYWGFAGWLGHDEDVWNKLLDAADDAAIAAAERFAELEQAGSAKPVIASDISANAVAVAAKSAARAGVAQLIDFCVGDVGMLSLDSQTNNASAAPSSERPQSALTTLIATNPPYGQRMGTNAQLPVLYAALSQLHRSFGEQGADIVTISSDEQIESYVGTPNKRIETYNGPLEVNVRFVGCDDSCVDDSCVDDACDDTCVDDSCVDEACAAVKASAAAHPTEHPQTEGQAQFANRLRKMAQHRGKWARRSGIGCYRIYDADLPDYAVAIDIYEGDAADFGKKWLVITEYKAPKEIDESEAQARLAQVLQIAPQLLGVKLTNVYTKQRKHSKGGSQYAPTQNKQVANSKFVKPSIVSESEHKFELDFASHLDCGLFLDHRLTRQMLESQAAGLDCLNLFAYTGSASVYMAAGGAKSVTTVDLSNTYIEWAQRNMQLNGFTGARYNFERADVLRWVVSKRREAARWDLVFVDVPTYSNSAAMSQKGFEVQRDHVELLISVSRLLTTGGQAIFSTNLRSFKPDVDALHKAKVAIKDISAQTIPADFERNPKIHKCFEIRYNKS